MKLKEALKNYQEFYCNINKCESKLNELLLIYEDFLDFDAKIGEDGFLQIKILNNFWRTSYSVIK